MQGDRDGARGRWLLAKCGMDAEGWAAVLDYLWVIFISLSATNQPLASPIKLNPRRRLPQPQSTATRLVLPSSTS